MTEFDGETYDEERDGERLSMSQLAAGVLENWLKAQGRLPIKGAAA